MARSDSRSQVASSQERNSQGIFSTVSIRADAISPARRDELQERQSLRATLETPRLLQGAWIGQFNGNLVITDNLLVTSTEPRRGRSRETSKTYSKSANASAQVRHVEGKFSSGNLIAVSESIPSANDTPTTGETSPSRSRSRSRNATLQKRDSKGRFCRINASADVASRKKKTTQKTPLNLSRSINPVSPKRDLRRQSSISRNSRHSTPEDETRSLAVSMIVGIEPLQNSAGMNGSEKQISKAKKANTKSPYFFAGFSLPTADNPVKASPEGATQTPKKRVSSKSPKTPKSNTGEETPKKVRTPRTPGGTVSCIPFPPLSAAYFGLIQEKLANDPFRLLIAVTFLIRTHGKHAIPVFYELMEKYPSPESLFAANRDDIVPLIRHLGLQNQRAGTYQTYAQIWLEDPPAKGKRYAVRDYPTKGAGRDIKKGEILSDEDERVAWEIGHMTHGPYAIDSWRIFCRDVLRGVADGWNGEGAEEGFQPEWMRVLPEDKELRAYLRWMWLKEGFEWDPFTGEKWVASERLTRAAMEGKIAWDDKGGMRILDDPNDSPIVQEQNPTPDEADQLVI